MKIYLYRTGFAVNGSAKFQYFPDVSGLKNQIVENFFNWENFSSTSFETRNKFIYSMIKSNIDSSLPQYAITSLIKYFLPRIKQSDINGSGQELSFVCGLPYEINSSVRIPHDEFTKDLIKYLQSYHLTHKGETSQANSIGEKDLSDIDDLNEILFIKDESLEDCVLVQDNKVWKAFNPKTGTKLQFSFDNSNKQYKKSSVPELVNLVITDKCSINCEYCYTNSSPRGKSAELDQISSYLLALSSLGTFEININGGDILEYSDLDSLCKMIQDFCSDYRLGISTSLHSQSIDSCLPEVNKIINAFSSVSFSVDSVNSLDNYIVYILNQNIKGGKRLPVQLVPELLSLDTLNRIIDLITHFNISVTLLGVRKFGRCTNKFNSMISKSHEDTSWLDRLQKYAGENLTDVQLCFDSNFIKNFPQVKNDSFEWLQVQEEGKFSCSINTVNHTLSSYSSSNDEYSLLASDNQKQFFMMGHYAKAEQIKKYFAAF